MQLWVSMGILQKIFMNNFMTDTYYNQKKENTMDTNIYYSQFDEDKILSKIFKTVKKGICVEVGANDGINDSTTYHFERKGWQCVLIEPNPDLCKSIRSVRKAQLFECAASDKNGEVYLNVAEGKGRAHGVSTICNDQKAIEFIESFGFKIKSVKINIRTLDDMLNELQRISKIDFITIDVEGNELNVLKGFDLNKWKPTILIIEDNSYYKDDTIVRYLKSEGYIRFRRTGVNDWYSHKSNKDFIKLINKMNYQALKTKYLIGQYLKKYPNIKRIIYTGYKAINSIVR